MSPLIPPPWPPSPPGLGGGALPSPLSGPLRDPALDRAGVVLRLKRDDLIHPDVPGNKWRKLSLNLRAALEAGHTRLLTFGGAYSHHVAAVAAAAAAAGLGSTGVIRGEELAGAPRNAVLARAEADGMALAFVSRAEYRATLRALGEPETARALRERFGRCYVLPEGGSNALGARGAAATVEELTDLGPGDVVCCAVGTGGTLAGLAAALPPGARALGVAVLKGGAGYLEGEVARLHAAGWGRTFPGAWRIEHGHHHGGYGRVPVGLAAFAAAFEERHQVAVERRYVAKMLHAVHALAGTAALPPGTRVTAVVTGPPTPESPPAGRAPAHAPARSPGGRPSSG
ncbi:pyridoxal-phosphate dependent enzyme [Streptomyces sp. DSM 44917]|uniref:Pyridoxal-phosphate dependent enzyme n=1 Tax=Streptomyces boetiae TaxID=3075541 RepID=A0ABU2LDN0_9ACTN|nr:pyridoxal-phosphate dependent enzyme [Streptomyces sp. DSM 44917]MDT0309373.1 pyridoxal-phosphate dependent enzyme [Streptomyces sp. DSM 44917]